ncbi:hypothetical protein LCGC14_0611200 [marine sediment metagenome]|uniref:Uncharacterized protein n=1 Tax=marine sediment metagenome TaxID=412755 RepID=A0A0F9UG41_9ZZZZ
MRTDNSYQPSSTDVWLGAENYFIQVAIEEAAREVGKFRMIKNKGGENYGKSR